uniref:Uncharacterized protein n=1 Tax=Octopus bimaculoides TaxID=37653 RepID=A0A0L8GUD8_OCTBM
MDINTTLEKIQAGDMEGVRNMIDTNLVRISGSLYELFRVGYLFYYYYYFIHNLKSS